MEDVDQAQWLSRLPTLMQAYNNTVQSASGMTPYYVVFGWHARLPVDWVVLSPAVEAHPVQDWALWKKLSITD